MAGIDRERLAKFLGMLGSAHDGEVVNAARMAERLRKAAGIEWSDILGGSRSNSSRFDAVLERELERARQQTRQAQADAAIWRARAGEWQRKYERANGSQPRRPSAPWEDDNTWRSRRASDDPPFDYDDPQPEENPANAPGQEPDRRARRVKAAKFCLKVADKYPNRFGTSDKLFLHQIVSGQGYVSTTAAVDRLKDLVQRARTYAA